MTLTRWRGRWRGRVARWRRVSHHSPPTHREFKSLSYERHQVCKAALNLEVAHVDGPVSSDRDRAFLFDDKTRRASRRVFAPGWPVHLHMLVASSAVQDGGLGAVEVLA